MQTVHGPHGPMPEFVQPAQALEKLFYEDQLVLFQKRTVVFMRESFPALASTLAQPQLENLAMAVMKQAARWNYVTEREIWQYLIAVAYCGFFFDADPQYADLLHVTGWHEKEAGRSAVISRFLDIVDEYYIECEKDFETFGRRLKYVARFYMSWNYAKPLTDDMRAAMAEKVLQAVFPARFALFTPQARLHLLSTHLQHTDRLGFSVKDSLIYALAAIYFGQAFEQSPVYPWAHFLGNTDVPAAERAKQFINAAHKHFSKLTIP